MNLGPEAQAVFLVATVTHVPGDTPGIKPVRPVWMDQNNCRDSAYGVPAGKSNRVVHWTSSITGRVVAASGHLHDGGLRSVLANDTTGEEICTTYAGYGTDPAFTGGIETISGCAHDRIGVIRAGDVLSLDSYYDSPEAQGYVMAVVVAYVYETDDLTGGTRAPAQAPPANNQPPDRLPGHGHH